MTHVTPQVWHATRLQHPSYGSPTSYRLAAQWVEGCRTVDDWGGSFGFLRHFLPGDVRYRVIDGTTQHADTVLADLTTFAEPADGIVLRHVLDMARDWPQVLENALAAFQRRLVVVTFTPDAPTSHIHKMKSGWPVWSFNPDDLRRAMGPLLVGEDRLHESHPERLYYLERRAA